MIEAIKARRSIRHFLPTPLSKEQLEEIVRAGMAAPSAKNLQPWHFVVTEGKAKERVCGSGIPPCCRTRATIWMGRLRPCG